MIVFCGKMTSTLRQLQRATEIVERYRARGNVLPRELSKNHRKYSGDTTR